MTGMLTLSELPHQSHSLCQFHNSLHIKMEIYFWHNQNVPILFIVCLWQCLKQPTSSVVSLDCTLDPGRTGWRWVLCPPEPTRHSSVDQELIYSPTPCDKICNFCGCLHHSCCPSNVFISDSIHPCHSAHPYQHPRLIYLYVVVRLVVVAQVSAPYNRTGLTTVL